MNKRVRFVVTRLVVWVENPKTGFLAHGLANAYTIVVQDVQERGGLGMVGG